MESDQNSAANSEDNAAKLARDDLEVGMAVVIDGEVCEIVALEANHLKVLDEDGVEVHYSWRRMPDIFAGETE